MTAKGRREGTFPSLADLTRVIHRDDTWDDAYGAVEDLQSYFRFDRAGTQSHRIYLGVEKAGLVAQLHAWFRDRGLPILSLRGYASQSYVDEIAAEAEADPRPAVLLYAGDFDPSGQDILRDFLHRTEVFDHVHHVVLTRDQVEAYRLPRQPGKATDSRAASFVLEQGELVQVEVDAFDPNDLRDLFTRALRPWWSQERFEEVLEEEEAQRGEFAWVLQALR